jgi:hypothetical protein
MGLRPLYAPRRPEYSKTTPQTGGGFYFLIEKLSKTAFFEKTLNKI